MLHTRSPIVIGMAARLQNIVEPNHVAFYVGVRIRNGIPHAGLRPQIDYHIRMILLKNAVNQLPFFVKLVVSKSDVYSYYIPISKGLVA